MARFFADTDVKIYTVDADANQYEKKGGLLTSTAARLAPFSKNLKGGFLKCLRANSFKQAGPHASRLTPLTHRSSIYQSAQTSAEYTRAILARC